MSTTSKLSKTEVDALIAGLDGSEPSDSGSESLSADKKVRDFKFGSDDLSLLGDYYALRVIMKDLRVSLDQFFSRCCEFSLGSQL